MDSRIRGEKSTDSFTGAASFGGIVLLRSLDFSWIPIDLVTTILVLHGFILLGGGPCLRLSFVTFIILVCVGLTRRVEPDFVTVTILGVFCLLADFTAEAPEGCWIDVGSLEGVSSLEEVINEEETELEVDCGEQTTWVVCSVKGGSEVGLDAVEVGLDARGVGLDVAGVGLDVGGGLVVGGVGFDVEGVCLDVGGVGLDIGGVGLDVREVGFNVVAVSLAVGGEGLVVGGVDMLVGGVGLVIGAAGLLVGGVGFDVRGVGIDVVEVSLDVGEEGLVFGGVGLYVSCSVLKSVSVSISSV